MWKYVAVLTASLVLAGCGDDDGTGPSPESLTGTWQATKAEMVSAANPSLKIELISLGATLELVLSTNQAFTMTATIPGEPPEVQTGTWSSSSDVLVLKPSGQTFDWTFDMTLTGTTLTLSGAHVEFDLNDDGVDDEAILNLVMQRQ